jgi:hypothetical protein
VPENAALMFSVQANPFPAHNKNAINTAAKWCRNTVIAVYPRKYPLKHQERVNMYTLPSNLLIALYYNQQKK